MLVENQLIEIRWHNRTKTWYEQKGYKFSHIGETFIVKAEDIYPNSAVNINVKCDHCGKIFSQQYYYYTKTQKKNGTECVHCKGKYNAIKSLSKRQKDFYNDAIDICNKHGYTLVSNPSEYTNSYSIIEYICPKHGLQKIKYYNLRHLVKAGITGLSHVYGNYYTLPEYRYVYDLIYISNYSMLLDIRIVIKTVFVVLYLE